MYEDLETLNSFEGTYNYLDYFISLVNIWTNKIFSSHVFFYRTQNMTDSKPPLHRLTSNSGIK